MQQIAMDRNGKCLSKKYINSYTDLEWECVKKHTWKTTPHTIKQGAWCPYCAKNRKSTIKKMREIAELKNGKCLSKKYVNARTKLTWKCEKGHVWQSIPDNIKHKSWCPVCAIENKKDTIEKMQDFAEKKGGKCLSEIYINNATYLNWRCERGHEWKAKPNKILSGRWCPKCNINKREEECREVFESIYNKPFENQRPGWLLSEKGWRMELDGYNEELKIAFEYNGIQHYKNVKYFHNPLKRRQFLDKLKLDLCEKNGVKLYVIPYTVKNLRDYIEELIKCS